MDGVQLFSPALWRGANRVEVLFRAPISDHEGVGAVISRLETSVGAPSFDLGWDGGARGAEGMPGVGILKSCSS